MQQPQALTIAKALADLLQGHPAPTEHLNKQGVSQSDVAVVIQLSDELVRQHSTAIAKVTAELHSHDGDEGIFCQCLIQGDIDTAVAMNLEMAERLAALDLPRHIEDAVMLHYY